MIGATFSVIMMPRDGFLFLPLHLTTSQAMALRKEGEGKHLFPNPMLMLF